MANKKNIRNNKKIDKDIKNNKKENNEIEKEPIIKEKIIYVEKKKSKKKLIVFIFIFILLIAVFIWWWFNRKFDITFKYNNGLENNIVKVRYLNKINDEDVKKDLKKSNYSFIGYFETYYLGGSDIEKIKNYPQLENSICKKNFKLDNNKNKCIAINEFDFKNTKIKSNKTIEALWSTITFTINPSEKTIYIGDSFNISVTISGTNDTRVNWSVDNNDIASVSNSGHVIGNKVGKTTVYVESNGIRRSCVVNVIEKEQLKQEIKEELKQKVNDEPKQEVIEEPKVEKDEGTISLNANDQCIIGYNSVTVYATIDNAKDDTINWSNLKCFNIDKQSNNKISVSRIGRGTMCRDNEEVNPIITATLNNGNYDSLKFNYESSLSIKVYDGNKEIQPNSEGVYIGNNVKIVSNQEANFTAVNPWNSSQSRIYNVSENFVHLMGSSDTNVTVKTTCGQSITLKVNAEIN